MTYDDIVPRDRPVQSPEPVIRDRGTPLIDFILDRFSSSFCSRDDVVERLGAGAIDVNRIPVFAECLVYPGDFVMIYFADNSNRGGNV